jgi:hypothetical protein
MHTTTKEEHTKITKEENILLRFDALSVIRSSRPSRPPLKVRDEVALVDSSETPDRVIPAWSAGIQVDMDVSAASLRAWMPAVRAGMTEISIFMLSMRA